MEVSKLGTIGTHPLFASGLLVFGRISGAARNRLVWMALGLCAEILPNRLQGTRAYGLQRVALRPSQSIHAVAEALDVRLVCTASLEPLHETAQVRLGGGPNQQVEVRRHDPHFEHVSAFLASDAPEIVTEERC